MELDGVPPANVQLHEVGVLVLKSVKLTVLPSHKVVGLPLKSATGAEPHGAIVTLVLLKPPLPQLLLGVTVTLPLLVP